LLATFLAELGARSARCHLLLRFTRTQVPRPGARWIDSMGIAAMTSMVFADGDNGPTHEEMFDAARRAGGRPGAFLSNLRAHVADPPLRIAVVHESSPAYVVPTRETVNTKRSVGRSGCSYVRRGCSRHAASTPLRQHARHNSVGLRATAGAAIGRSRPSSVRENWQGVSRPVPTSSILLLPLALVS